MVNIEHSSCIELVMCTWRLSARVTLHLLYLWPITAISSAEWLMARRGTLIAVFVLQDGLTDLTLKSSQAKILPLVFVLSNDLGIQYFNGTYDLHTSSLEDQALKKLAF